MSTNSQFTIMVHILALLANAREPLSSAIIAGSVNTHPVVIRQTVALLRDAGLVETLPGCSGGARLTREPAAITLCDVYRLVKAETLFALHPNAPNPLCPIGRNIQAVLVDVSAEMDTLLSKALAGISIADVLQRVSDQETLSSSGTPGYGGYEACQEADNDGDETANPAC